MKVKVAGKLNLDLYVTGMRGGLHTLDSVMCSVSVYDKVSVKKSRRTAVYENGVLMDESAPAYRAIRAFESSYGPVSVTVRIKKGIPFSSGMGGSSADSAAVLFCLGALYHRVVDPYLALKAGSDTPFMLYGGFLRVEGVGEQLTALPYKRLKVLLVKHGSSLSAKDVYARFDEANKSPSKRVCAYTTDDFDAYLAGASNDLYPCVAHLDNVQSVMSALLATNPVKAQMTGSGPAVFAVYETDEELKRAYKKVKQLGFECIKILKTKRMGILFTI